ncbi:DUF2799 domain-containing protein [Beggiatoa leptomitoformis]|uniref:DUF2799 domain-containing protein n=1 Tax=Beggiatoa leptomitoformis TaxID=288004 RepID=A0A2N9YDE7_9GAMM|nr:DUF2799 domain-containing protein [Beggiatoa leptomitoformis]AUI68494.2 DUF2799 domain-containing protein [Beggiatoa leptomitoformis]QGX03844.1 DUF2799 domain-containing protein [Beggiatoa leptomitoformis]
MIKKMLFAGSFMFLLAGCASLSQEECQQGNWQTIGYNDGAQGYKVERFSSHQEACAEYKVRPNFQLYKQGYEKGIVTYCRPNKGYDLGKQLSQYEGVCPSHLETAFLNAYLDGLEANYRAAQTTLNSKNSEYRRLSALLSSSREENTRRKIQNDLKTLDNEIEQLESKQETAIELRDRAESILSH